MKVRLQSLALVAALAVPSLLGHAPLGPRNAAAEDVDPTLAQIGATTFRKRCASCHGADARGEGPAAKALRRPPPDLTHLRDPATEDFPGGRIARVIDGRFEVAAHGTRDMPVWGERLTGDIPDESLAEEIRRGTIAALVEYLKSIQAEP